MLKSFQELIVWQKAHCLTLKIYQLSKEFPKEEIFTLTSQIRRASISVESNIAEGFSRRSSKESKRFYYMANASLEETKCQLLIAKDLKYLSERELQEVYNIAEEVGKLLNSWIKSQKA